VLSNSVETILLTDARLGPKPHPTAPELELLALPAPTSPSSGHLSMRPKQLGH
jgi:hypothetical protein